MSVNQGDFTLRYTGNYLDQIYGFGYHLQPITFHEFLSKPESLFMYDDTFMQVPGYVQSTQEIMPVEEQARQFVVSYIMDEFEHKILGMQDYVRWATLFKHRCEAISPSFWSQVNMISLMTSKDLEIDENTYNRTNTGNASRLGGQTTTTDQTGSSITEATANTSQDVTNTQETDTSSREGVATVIRAENQLTDDLDYNWSDAADNIREVRSRNGDTKQHMESQSQTNSTTNTQNNGTSTTTMNNSEDQNTSTGSDVQSLTNKMFMQERQWAIDTARNLLPLEWLRAQLQPMFYMIY